MPHVHARDLLFLLRPLSTDNQIIEEVVTNDSYGIWGRLRPGDIVFDIGGHIGAFTVFASRLGAEVYSFEATELNFGLLKSNIELNGFSAHIQRVAIMGKEEKQRKVFIRKSNFGGNNMYGEDDQNAEYERVDCITLNQACKQWGVHFIDFLKLDCEGAEVEILESFDLTRVKNMAIEIHGDNLGKVLKLIENTHRVTGRSRDEKHPILLLERKNV